MDYRQQEQIENYHSGRLTPDESAAFESKLSSDPDLKAESDLQSDIINGLKDYRKAQLKARLDAVNIGPSWIEFAQQSTLLKSFGGVAVASIVGAGVYFYAEPKVEIEGNPIVINAPEYENPDVIWNLGLEEIEIPENRAEQVEAKPVSQPKTVAIEKSVVEEVESKEPEVASQPFTPAFDAPTAENINDEEAPTTSDLDKLPEESAVASSIEPIDVKTEIKKNLKIQYKYYDGKLFLSGDFDRAPYEILEINSASGRRIYVKYLEKFYKVNTTDRLTDLPEVTDKEVIEELKLLRQNK